MSNEDLDAEQVVHRVNDSKGNHLGHMIHCPACQCGHLFDSRWTFNGDYMKPTFKPSMHVNKDVTLQTCKPKKHRCHSFVTNGAIKFLGDCTHNRKNVTMKLEVF